MAQAEILYTDHDAFVCRWLEGLVAGGALAPGEVAEAEIEGLAPSVLAGRRQVHLFCGIGGWPLALELARWPPEAPIWTGSPPCQPFSTAGARRGRADERHLWTSMAALIEQLRPPLVVGEQVDGALSLGWWDQVCEDCEAMGYAAWGAVLPAAAVGAPHARHRLFWAAAPAGPGEREPRDLLGGPAGAGAHGHPWARALGPALEAWSAGLEPEGEGKDDERRARVPLPAGDAEEPGGTHGARGPGTDAHGRHPRDVAQPAGEVGQGGGEGSAARAGADPRGSRLPRPGGSGLDGGGRADRGVGDAPRGGEGARERQRGARAGGQEPHRGSGGGVLGGAQALGHPARARRPQRGDVGAAPPRVGGPQRGRAAVTAGAWDDAELIAREDRRHGRVWCRIGAGLQPVADGVPGRLAQLRAIGNAVVAQCAAQWIRLLMATRPEPR